MRTTVLGLLLLASCFHAAFGQDDGVVGCFNSTSCDDGAPVSMSLEDCCLGNPGGVAYELSGEEQCNICVVFGWLQAPTFEGLESGRGYMLEIGYIKGLSEAGQFAAAEFRIVVSNGTAYEGVDFDVRSTEVSGAVMTDSVELVLREDGVAQEGDETFALTLVSTTSSSFEANFFLVDELSVTIIDADVVVFQLVGECAAEEGGGSVIARIVKEGNVSLANSVTLSITPLTVEDAEDRVSLLDIPPLNELSPNRADYSDFDVTPQLITFPSDEGGDLISEVDVSVAIQDDGINEALQQYFILTMDVLSRGLIDVRFRDTIRCSIADNDPIRLGFERSSYLFVRPLTQSLDDDTVFLAKENGQVSEQTFYARVTTSPSSGAAVSAILNVDYSLTEFELDFATLLFPPHLDRVAVDVNLLVPVPPRQEPAVDFQLTFARIGGTPLFLPPAGLFQNTVATIQALQIGFVVQQLLVTEGSVATLEVSVLSGTLTTDVTVFFSTQDGTALSGLDFTGVDRLPLNFTFTTSSLTVDVSISSDSVAERTERFQCLLELLDNEDNDDILLSLVPNAATITVQDLNDGEPEPDEEGDVVACYSSTSCGGGTSIGSMTVRQCCVETEGLSYFGRSGCTICSLYGWNITNLMVTESAGSVPVALRMVKGFANAESPSIALVLLDEQVRPSPDMPIGYTVTDLPSVFPLNNVSTFNLSVPLDDIINEPDGLLRFTLQTTPGSELPAGLFLTNPLEVTVQDGTEFSVGFGEVDYRAIESESAVISVILLNPSLRIADPIGIQITTLTEADSVALGNPLIVPPPDSPFSPNLADYNDFPRISERRDITTFPGIFSINITDDEINEADEQYFVAMLEVVNVTYPSLVTVPDEREFTLIRIMDNDELAIGFTDFALSVDEPDDGSGETEIFNGTVLAKSIQSEQTYILQISTTPRCNDSADNTFATFRTESGNEDADLEILTTLNGLLFPPEVQTLPILVALFGDDRIEGQECYDFQLFPDVTIGPSFSPFMLFQEQTVFIRDNAFVLFGFEQDSYSVPESVGSVEICTNISSVDALQFVGETLFLQINIVPITAGLDDFEGEIPFVLYMTEDRNPRACFNLTIVDDDIRELAEMLNVTLLDSDLEHLDEVLGFTIGLSHTIVTIQPDGNDTTDVIAFLSTPPVLSEDDEVVTILVGVKDIDGGFNNNTVVLLSILDSSEGTDSEGVIIPVSFESPLVPVQYSFIDNDVYEVESRIVLSLSLASPDNATAVVNEGLVTIILQDDDDLQIGWSAESLTVSEDAGMITIPISFTGDAGQYEIIINGTVEDASAEAGVDFLKNTESSRFEIRLSNSARSQNISVSIIQDDISELEESFTLSLESVSVFDLVNRFIVDLTEGDRDRLLFTIRETTVTVQDDDVVTVGFLDSPSEIVVSEDVGDILLEVGVISGVFTFDIAIQISIMSLSAAVDLDYNFTQLNFTLSNGTQDLRFPFNISILDDSQLEDTEMFIVVLTAPSSATTVNLVNPEVEVTVIDNDVVVLGFLTSEVSGMEGSTVQISVGVSQGFLGLSVSGTVLTADGSAEAGEDYNSTTVPLVFTGQDIFVINLTLINNIRMDTENETFTVQLVLDDPPPNLQVGLASATVTIIENVPEPAGGNNNTVTIVTATLGAFVFVFLLMILMLVIFIVVSCSHRKKKADLLRNLGTDPSSNIYLAANNGEFYHMTVHRDLRINVPNHLIIDSANLHLDEPVGQGEYGIVYKGKLSEGFNTGFSQIVAVKTLKGFLEKSKVRDLLQECTQMSEFDHPNVLTLTGVCLDGGPAPYIVMPFMFNGSLLSYLKKERDHLVLPPQQELDSETLSVSSKLMDMCIQVAKGMEYLASKRVVHRDLAARNCMIDINFVIKVADFGLSETVDPSKDYFRQDKTDGMKLPVKWLAPECLSDGKFSEKSDVWAFGVTCWEVFSGGKMPYSGINPVELPQMLENGYRMEKPSNSACLDEMFDVVTKCWAGNYEDRPTFSDIVTLLSQSLETLTGYTALVADEGEREAESEIPDDHFAPQAEDSPANDAVIKEESLKHSLKGGESTVQDSLLSSSAL